MVDPSTKFNPIDIPCIYTLGILFTGFFMNKTFDDRIAYVTNPLIVIQMIAMVALIVVTVEIANKRKVAPLLTAELHLSHFYLMNGSWWYLFFGFGMSLTRALGLQTNTLYTMISRIDTRFTSVDLFSWPVLAFLALGLLSSTNYYFLRTRNSILPYTQLVQHLAEAGMMLLYFVSSASTNWETFPSAPHSLSFKAIHLVYFWIPLGVAAALCVFALYRIVAITRQINSFPHSIKRKLA